MLARSDEDALALRRALDARELLEPSRAVRRARSRTTGVRSRFDARASSSAAIAIGSSRRSATSSTTRSGTAAGRPARGRARRRLVELHVLDEGPGFPPEFLPHAFERFSRADAGADEGGAGLGLAIVDAIARAHGGRASAAGATVTLVLPLRSA